MRTKRQESETIADHNHLFVATHQSPEQKPPFRLSLPRKNKEQRREMWYAPSDGVQRHLRYRNCLSFCLFRPSACAGKVETGNASPSAQMEKKSMSLCQTARISQSMRHTTIDSAFGKPSFSFAVSKIQASKWSPAPGANRPMYPASAGGATYTVSAVILLTMTSRML